VLVEAVLQLGDTVQELMDQLVGLVESQRRNRWYRLLFGHTTEHAPWAGSSNRQMRIKRRSSLFPVKPLSVNGYSHRSSALGDLFNGFDFECF
jgi:hypothetical protein